MFEVLAGWAKHPTTSGPAIDGGDQRSVPVTEATNALTYPLDLASARGPSQGSADLQRHASRPCCSIPVTFRKGWFTHGGGALSTRRGATAPTGDRPELCPLETGSSIK